MNYISGYTAKGVLHIGRLGEHTEFLAKLSSASELARNVRQILDKGA